MDKYIAAFTASDFILADAGHFQTGGEVFNPDMALPEDAVEEVEARGGITAGGRTYGCTSPVEEFITEEYYRSVWGRWNDAETLDQMGPAWTARRTACWPTGPSSTVWSGLPWTA